MSALPNESSTDQQEATGYAIGQTFDFVQAAIDVPGLLDFFPDNGTLALREVEIHGHVFQFAAVHPRDADSWLARPSRYAPKAEAVPFRRPIAGVQFDPGDRIGRTLAIVEAFSTAGPTETVALDALEAALRVAIADAVRVELAEIERRG